MNSFSAALSMTYEQIKIYGAFYSQLAENIVCHGPAFETPELFHKAYALAGRCTPSCLKGKDLLYLRGVFPRASSFNEARFVCYGVAPDDMEALAEHFVTKPDRYAPWIQGKATCLVRNPSRPTLDEWCVPAGLVWLCPAGATLSVREAGGRQTNHAFTPIEDWAKAFLEKPYKPEPRTIIHTNHFVQA